MEIVVPKSIWTLKSVLPEANSIAKRHVTKAIPGIDSGPFTQQILHHFQMALTRGDVEGSAAIIICHAQVSALYRRH